jgi:hypothetical protein
MFITFGEVLLSSGEYDQLYYEIIRERKVVEDFCNLGESAVSGTETKEKSQN